ncbi:MAG: family 16 glycoside hydrolase, partial [Flavitalea sp.]
MKLKLTLLLAGASICAVSNAQNRVGGDPKLSEIYSPVAPVVKPGNSPADAPSDAIILFDGKDLSKWTGRNGGDAAWTVENGAMTVKPGSGQITTKEGF